MRQDAFYQISMYRLGQKLHVTTGLHCAAFLARPRLVCRSRWCTNKLKMSIVRATIVTCRLPPNWQTLQMFPSTPSLARETAAPARLLPEMQEDGSASQHEAWSKSCGHLFCLPAAHAALLCPLDLYQSFCVTWTCYHLHEVHGAVFLVDVRNCCHAQV